MTESETTELKLEMQKLLRKERVNSKHLESWIRKKRREDSSSGQILSESYKEIYLSVESAGDVPSQHQLIKISYLFYKIDPDFILKEILMKYLYWEQLVEKPNFFFAIAAKSSLSQILSNLRKEDLDFLISFVHKIFVNLEGGFPFLDFLRILSNASDDLSISIRTELDLVLKKLLEKSDSYVPERMDSICNLLLLDLYLDQRSSLSLEELSHLVEKLMKTNDLKTNAILSLVLFQWQRNPENINTYEVAKKYWEATKKLIFEEKLFSFIEDRYLKQYLLSDAKELVISLFPFLLSYDQKRILNLSPKEVYEECYRSQERVDYNLWEFELIMKRKLLLIEKCKKIKSSLVSWGIDISQEIREVAFRRGKGRKKDVYDLQSEIRDDLSLCKPVTLNFEAAIDALVGLSDLSRRTGILSLEDELGSIDDPFLLLGLQAICDGTDPEEMKFLLDPRIKGYIDAVDRYYTILKIGILKIQEGTNPRVVRQILEGYRRERNVIGIGNSD